VWLAAEHVSRLEGWIDGFGAWGPVVYVATWGFLGAAAGAVAAFYVARLGRRTWIEERLTGLPRMQRFDRSVARHGRRIVLLMRLSPLVPFSILNYALGLSRVRARDYIVATPGMFPSILLYVYSGDVAREVVEAAGGRVDKPWWEWVILAVGLVATVAAAHLLGKKAKQAMGAEVVEEEERLEDELLEPGG